MYLNAIAMYLTPSLKVAYVCVCVHHTHCTHTCTWLFIQYNVQLLAAITIIVFYFIQFSSISSPPSSANTPPSNCNPLISSISQGSYLTSDNYNLNNNHHLSTLPTESSTDTIHTNSVFTDNLSANHADGSPGRYETITCIHVHINLLYLVS